MNDANHHNSEPSSADLSGRQMGDFRLLRRLGRGAMAEVYLAEQCSLNRQVAIKVLKTELSDDETYVKRFQREAQAAAALVHANIVQIHEVGCIDNLYYIAQEYVQGLNLREWITRNGTPDLRLSLIVMRQVAAALAKAADQGIIHRDVKPENIMLTRGGEVKVADFGLARLPQVTDGVELTQVGVTMGTPLYMSPEQIEGQTLDPRTDLYSFGVTCYHMLAGSPPFGGETALSVAVQHLKKTPEPLENIRPDLPPALCRIIRKMLAKSREDRYQSARKLLRDLRQLQLEHLDDEQWPEDLPGWETADLDVGVTRIETTQRLDALMKTARLDTHRRARWVLWTAGGLASLLLGSAVAFFAIAEPPLLSRDGIPPPMVSPKETVGAQWLSAMQLRTEEAWRAVIDNFPDKQYWYYHAKQQLARIYVLDDEDDKAEKIFEELAALDQTWPPFRAYGLAGQFWILTKQEKFKEAEGKFYEFENIRLDLRDPFMIRLVSVAAERHPELNRQTVQSLGKWAREQLGEDDDD